MKRENFASRLGFILVSAGCAIGIGNVWRFPYVAGQNGGGVFVLFYLLFLIIMGVPVLTMEISVGRAGQGSVLHSMKALEKPGHKWHLHGWLCLAGCCLLMMYYTTVCGWMMGYMVKFMTGSVFAADTVQATFDTMTANPWEMGLWMLVSVVLGFAVCSFGVQNGVERVNKVMMMALLVLIVVLAINSFTLPKAGEGLRYYLLPDLARANEVGLLNVIVAAMNQSFFTLSLGIGSMEIFGSYMTREQSIGGEAVRICALDTFVAVFAGLIIFPACLSFDVPVNAGPSLIFVALPEVFRNMTGGRIWGALFFLFMTFASLTTVIAVFEYIIASVMELLHWSRKKACVLCGAFLLVGSIPCVLGFNVLKGFQPLGAGSTILDLEDFIVSNLLLPLGSLLFVLFCSTKYGWGFDKYLAEANTGKGMQLSRNLKPYFQFVLPVLILIILLAGLLPKLLPAG